MMDSYHCPDWADQAAIEISEDGESLAELYSQYRCDRFKIDSTEYLDRHGDHLETDSWGDMTCAEHEVRAIWDGEPTYTEVESAQDSATCLSCDLIFPGYESLQQHEIDEHDAEDAEDDAPHPLQSIRTIWRNIVNEAA